MNPSFVPLNSIIIPPDRQRRYFDLAKLLELADDIHKNGLLHAPVLQSDTLDLVAGERRLRAIEILYDTHRSFRYAGGLVPPGMVPVTRAHSRDALGWLEAELSENLARQDLTWQERAHALLQLDRLRKKQNPEHTTAQTIAEVRQVDNPPGEDTLREELLLANHLDDEDVAKQKTRGDAMRILRRKAQIKHAEELGAKFKLETQFQSPHTPIQGDSREILPTLAGPFDLILTDPPYGISANEHGSMNILGHRYDDTYLSWRELMLWFSKESFRVSADSAHLYVFCEISHWFELRDLFDSAGWRVMRRPIIWNKGNGMLPYPDLEPRRTYEAILFASKGEKKLQVVGSPDVISVPMLTGARTHGAEKPVPLYIELMKRSALPGNSVLDPFMGSGTIFPAANACKLRATGIEQDPAFFGIATTRLGVRA